jgi:putative acetyltransferase
VRSRGRGEVATDTEGHPLLEEVQWGVYKYRLQFAFAAPDEGLATYVADITLNSTGRCHRRHRLCVTDSDMGLVIRDEAPTDVASIHALNAAVFESDAEAQLVDSLRAHGSLTLSLVAVEEAGVVGHIAFSPLTITQSNGKIVEGVGLGPMAVSRALERSGVGTRLVTTGLDRLRAAGHRFCVVLGHPAYYPRFGFERASRFGIRWERDARDEAFFVLELARGGLMGVSGVVRYAPEFALVEVNHRHVR